MVKPTFSRRPHSVLAPVPPLNITLVTQENTYAWNGAFIPKKILMGVRQTIYANSDLLPEDERHVQTVLAFFLLTSLKDYQDELGARKQHLNILDVAASVTVRLTKSTPTTDTKPPPWTRQVKLYQARGKDDVNTVYTMTILGEPSEFLVATPDVSGMLENHKETWNCNRVLADLLRQIPRIPAKKNELVKFTWGQEDSPYHRLPDNDSDRVSVSIVFGSEREIREMCRKYKLEYRENDLDGVIIPGRRLAEQFANYTTTEFLLRE